MGKEFRTCPDDALYASTPPLEVLKVILSRAAAVKASGTKREMIVNDLARLLLHKHDAAAVHRGPY